MHHWWAEADRALGVTHNETLTHQEVVTIADKLCLSDAEVFEYFEETEPPQKEEFLKAMLRRCDELIEELEKDGDHTDLIRRGRELQALFSKSGYSDEGVVYVLGHK
jgi:hypothetical protein